VNGFSFNHSNCCHPCPHVHKVSKTCWHCGGTGRVCNNQYPLYTWTTSMWPTTPISCCGGCGCCCHYQTCSYCNGTGYVWEDEFCCDGCPHKPGNPPWTWHPEKPACHPKEPLFKEGFGINKRKVAR
jgi:hypothetical protein